MCVFDSMLDSNEQMIRSATFADCELQGPAIIRGAVIMDSCLVHGGLTGWGLTTPGHTRFSRATNCRYCNRILRAPARESKSA